MTEWAKGNVEFKKPTPHYFRTTNPDEPILIVVDEWKGERQLNMRKCWSPNGSGTTPVPTKQGFNIPLGRIALFYDTLTAILESEGLLPHESPVTWNTPTAEPTNPWADRWEFEIGGQESDSTERHSLKREADEARTQPHYPCARPGCKGTYFYRPGVGGWWCDTCRHLMDSPLERIETINYREWTGYIRTLNDGTFRIFMDGGGGDLSEVFESHRTAEEGLHEFIDNLIVDQAA